MLIGDPPRDVFDLFNLPRSDSIVVFFNEMRIAMIVVAMGVSTFIFYGVVFSPLLFSGYVTVLLSPHSPS